MDDYVKTTWKNGDIITASGLNKIEDALESVDTRCSEDHNTLSNLSSTVDTQGDSIKDIDTKISNLISVKDTTLMIDLTGGTE